MEQDKLEKVLGYIEALRHEAKAKTEKELIAFIKKAIKQGGEA